MFSRLQAAIPILTDDIHIDRWVKKIFPWKPDRKSSENAFLDNRECYRLNMEDLPPLDATLVSISGAIMDINVLNLSAGGLSCRVSTSERFYKGQVLTLVFVLPLEDLVLIKTEATLISVKPLKAIDSTILRIEFSNNLDSGKRDLIHGFVVKKQFEMIRKLKGWRIF